MHLNHIYCIYFDIYFFNHAWLYTCLVIFLKLYDLVHLKPAADLFLTMSEVNQIPNYEKPIR